MSETAEFVVVTGSAQDKLHLSMEVCLEIASRGDRATLVIPSHLSSAIPLSFTSNPLVAVAQIDSSSVLPTYLQTLFKCLFRRDLQNYLEKRRTAGGGKLPHKLYAVVGPGAESLREVFRDFNVTVDPLPFVGLAIQRLSKAPASDVRPGEYRVLAVLPEGMVIVRSDLNIKPSGPPRGGPPCPGPRPGGGGGGPPKLGDRPPSVPEVEGSIGRMSNNSADPKQPLLDHMGDQMKMPVCGIDPLLQEQYWKTSASVIYSREILSHPSTGGFLSHRGGNSMVEGIGQVVPLQAWPSRGDQHHNAKLVVSHRHPTMSKLFGWNSIAETSTHRSPFGTRPFPDKRYYNTDSPGDNHKVGHAASNDVPKNVMDDESKGIGKTMASEAFASFQFDLNFELQMGCFRLGASISRLAKRMR